MPYGIRNPYIQTKESENCLFDFLCTNDILVSVTLKAYTEGQDKRVYFQLII